MGYFGQKPTVTAIKTSDAKVGPDLQETASKKVVEVISETKEVVMKGILESSES